MQQLAEAAGQQDVWHAMAFTLAAALGGLFRVYRDDRYESWRRLVGLCGCSGLLGLVVLAGLSVLDPGVTRDLWRGLGVASFVGLFGSDVEEQIQRAIPAVFRFLLRRFGVQIEDDDDKQ